MLLVVVAIVLVLAARAWQEAAPTALLLNEEPQSVVNDHGQPEAKQALQGLPGLSEVRDSTGAHAEELERALAESN